MTEVDAKWSGEVEVGTEVEFVVTDNRGRPRAQHVRVLDANTVSFVQVLPETRRGVVLSVPHVNRDMAEEKHRRYVACVCVKCRVL